MANTLTPGEGLGLPVTLPQIHSTLTHLWKQGGATTTRASLINLVLYSETVGSLTPNSDTAALISRNHACRLLLVERPRDVDPGTPQAWVTAHCHVTRAGGKQVCCEQIALQLPGADDTLLANAILGNLDSDLPLVVWWQAPLPPPTERPLWSRIDRLLFDSATWPDLPNQITRMKAIQACGPNHVIFCDLNWARLFALRLALAQLHDKPGAANALSSLERLEIHHAPDALFCAGMLTAWFCRQLGWSLVKSGGGATLFKTNDTPPCEVVFVETECPSGVNHVSGHGTNYHFQVQSNPENDLLLGHVQLADGHRFHLTSPGSRSDIHALVSQELERGSAHRMYPEILELLSPLFPPNRGGRD